MSRVPGGKREFRFPWRSRRQIDAEIEEELRLHIDLRREELEGEGVARAEALRRAERELGDLRAARRSLARIDRGAEARSRLLRWLDELAHDARFALRTVRRSPGFSLVAVLVLGVAIGANTTIFSIVDTALLKPLAIEHPEELLGLFPKSTKEPDSFSQISYPDYVDLRDASRSFSSISAFTPTVVGVTNDGETQRSFALVVSSDYFRTFGVPLERGRGFSAEEEQPHAGLPVVVVSHEFWERSGRRYGLGAKVEVNGLDCDVVGVAPPGFSGTTAMFSPDLWLPLGTYDSIGDLFAPSDVDLGDRHSKLLMLIGRLAEGFDGASADAELAAVASRLGEQHPESFGDFTLVTAKLPRTSISTEPRDDAPLVVGSAVLMLMAGLVLLVACLNLANMMLARGSGRRTEMAIRLSLGGSPRRVLRQLLTEGLVLSLAGAGLGLGLAGFGVRYLGRSLTRLMPFGGLQLDAGADPRILAATLLFAVLATLLFALVPAMRTLRVDLSGDLKEKTGRPSGHLPGRLGPRNALVAAQIALSLGLLVTAGLFVRGALLAVEADPGFDLERGLLVQVDGSYAGYDEIRIRQAATDLLSRLRALPGVESVALASNVPFSSVSNADGLFLGPTAASDEAKTRAQQYVVGAHYFETLGMTLLRGREFTEREESSAVAPRVAIVSQGLAEALWPGEDPIGRTVWRSAESEGDPRVELVVVGVAPPVRQSLLSESTHIYEPFGQRFRRGLYLHVRPAPGGERSETLVGAIRNELLASESRLPLLGIERLSSIRDRNLELWLLRMAAYLFVVFGGVALFLAAVGVYAVKAHVVARRTREFGIRLALGAEPSDVQRMVVREGLWVTAVGVVLGLGIALGLGSLVAGALYQVSFTDPVAYVVAPLVLVVASLLAAWLPARRATRIPPSTALRYE